MIDKRISYILLTTFACLAMAFFLVSSAQAGPLAAELQLAANGEAYEVNADGQGKLWISDFAAGKIWQIDSVSGEAVVYNVGGSPSDARYDTATGYLWWGDALAGQLFRHNTGDGSTLQWNIDGSEGVYGTGLDQNGEFWATDLNYPYLYHQTATELCKYTLPSGGLSDYLVVDGDFVWLANWITHRVVRLQISLDQYKSWALAADSTPAGVALDDQGRLWWADPLKQELGRLDPDPAVNEVRYFAQSLVFAPQMLTFDGGMVWFTDQQSFGRLDPAAASSTFSQVLPATTTATENCTPNMPVAGPSVTTSAVNEKWSDVVYPTIHDAGGWQLFEMPNGSLTWGIAKMDGKLWIVDQGRQVLARVPLTAPTAIEVTKSPSLPSVPETGANVMFTFRVTNLTFPGSVTITELSDSLYGTLAGDADCLVGTILASGASCEFAITEWVEGDFSGPGHTNTFTAHAVDDAQVDVMDTAEAAVAFANVLPTIQVTKTANPTAVPETGGDVTFTFTVQNTSSEEAVTIQSLSDSVFGTLAGDADCRVDTVLAAGAVCEFAITEWVAGNFSGPDHSNVFTATAKDNDNTTATDNDDAVVDFSNVLPAIQVIKTANPTHVPETGAEVTFTFTVENTGPEAVTLNTLSDSRFSNLDGKGTCDTPQAIPVAGSYTCTYTISLASDSLTTHTNVVTAIAADNDGSQASDTDDAAVTFDNVTPTISVLKTANPTAVPEAGADVIFTFRVTNTSLEQVTITSLQDSVFGALAGDADCEVGTVLAAGAHCEFSITEWVQKGSAPSHVNVFTVHAVDNEQGDASAADDATVTFTGGQDTFYVYLPMIRR